MNNAIKYPDDDGSFIIIDRTESLCSSTIGWRRYKPAYSHLKDCKYPREYLHELTHTLGFAHEHQRPDRDSYVKVYEEKVIDQRQIVSFKIRPASRKYNYSLYPYDYNSIMHYETNAGVYKSDYSIVSRDESVFKTANIGPKETYSEIDKQQLRDIYSCSFNEFVDSWKTFQTLS
ncbi:hypothetical protein B4U80_07241 [Leptotrombidium deliense]|uniref:Metalloendopeptidase n=1 Tax=Leptotrombidium deliense TaxID=299467 RepID=A0A443RS84_9ACAR|nr:hypothetical protein B4U80_07241 [Leptotrombidium deliense]